MQQAAQASAEIDPVCGMKVDPAISAHKHIHQGRLYHFCSAGCRTKFAADPAKFEMAVKLMCGSGDFGGMLKRMGNSLQHLKDKELASTMSTCTRKPASIDFCDSNFLPFVRRATNLLRLARSKS